MNNFSYIFINIFDFSGDDDYKPIRTKYYSDSIGVLMVYDVNIKATFDSLTKWEKEAEKFGLDLTKCVVVVMGNKTDIKKREVKADIAKEWAKGRGYKFYESSAKSGFNVNDAFKYLLILCILKLLKIDLNMYINIPKIFLFNN